MTIYYSAENHACYDSNIKYPSLPSDLVELSDEDYKSYWLGANDGYQLKENAYPFEWEEIDTTNTDNASEYNWAASELSISDVEINKHLDGDSSSVSTEELWRSYRKDLRAYATAENGIYSLRTDKPVRPE